MKLGICGGPLTGKTTLAEQWDGVVPVIHTDDFIELGWSEASERVSQFFDDPGPYVVEGVAVPRALRKWMRRDPGKPLDKLIILETPHEDQSEGQRRMTVGHDTVLAEIEGALRARGVTIERRR